MAVIDGVFYLNARVTLQTLSVVTVELCQIMGTFNTANTIVRNKMTVGHEIDTYYQPKQWRI